MFQDHLVIIVDKKERIKIKIDDEAKMLDFLEDVQKLKDLETQKYKDNNGEIDSYTENINSNNDTYFFVSVLRNKRDLSYARGSIVKAMSIASKYRYVESFHSILDKALADYFEIFKIEEDDKTSIAKAEVIMAELFKQINTECIISEFNKSTFFEKRVYNDIKIYVDDNDLTKLGHFYYEKYVKWNGSYTKIELPKALDCDKVSDFTNLKSFILKLGHRVMVIYNYILFEKRVMFIGNKHSANVMSEYVYTCIEML
jgi:hypothetical protein